MTSGHRALNATPRLDSLTGLRFYAALAVLLRHAVPGFLEVPALDRFVEVGPVGVGFFFILSGFVLAWSYDPALPPSVFYWRRFARIYPLHVLTSVLMVGYVAAVRDPLHLRDAALSLALVQSWFPESYRIGGNTVSWSLSCEMFFYACFPLLIGPLSRLTIRGVRLVAACVYVAMAAYIAVYVFVTVAAHADVNLASPYTNPGYRLGEFVIGICAARFIRAGGSAIVALRPAFLLAAAAFVGLGVLNSVAHRVAHQQVPLFVMDWLFLPFAALLLLAAARADLNGQPSALASRAHVLLGQWSFALYLIQFLVILPLLAVIPAGAGLDIRVALLILVIAMSVAASGVLFHLFEMPCERRLRGLVSRRDAAASGCPLEPPAMTPLVNSERLRPS